MPGNLPPETVEQDNLAIPATTSHEKPSEKANTNLIWNWIDLFERRHESSGNRVWFIRYTILGLFALALVSVVVIIPLAGWYFYVVVASIGITAIIHCVSVSRRRWKSFWPGLRMGLLQGGPVLVWVLVIFGLESIINASIAWILLVSGILIAAYYQLLTKTESWLIEIKGLQVFSREHSLENLPPSVQSRQSAKVNPRYQRQLVDVGVDRGQLEGFLKLGAPRNYIDQLKHSLNHALLQERIEKTAKEMNIVDPGEINDRLVNIVDYLDDNNVDIELKKRQKMLRQFIKDAQKKRKPPVFWICPSDSVQMLWDKAYYLWINKVITGLVTSEGAPFSLQIEFAVLPEPEKISATNFHLVLTSNSSPEKIEDFIDKAFTGNINKAAGDYFATKSFTEAFSHKAISQFGKELSRVHLAELLNATGTSVQEWSVDISPLPGEGFMEAVMVSYKAEWEAKADFQAVEQIFKKLEGWQVPEWIQATLLSQMTLYESMPPYTRYPSARPPEIAGQDDIRKLASGEPDADDTNNDNPSENVIPYEKGPDGVWQPKPQRKRKRNTM